jgi:hypothetical protein
VEEFLHRRLDVRRIGVQLVHPCDPADLDLDEVPGREPVGEERVVDERLARDLTVLLADLDVVPHHLEQLRNGLRVLPVVVDRLLDRLHEQLLAREAEEIRVGVPVADEVEGLPALELLVARPEVDRRVDAAGRVVVPAVDVHPDAAELVHDVAEALEVDRDQVVDREVRERAHGFERAGRPTERVRLVDPARVCATVRAAAVDDQVAREREQRDRVRGRVGSEEHDRVRARRGIAVAGPVVVADQERVRGLAGDRVVEALRGLGGLHRARSEGVRVLVRVDVRAACDPEDRRHGERDEDEDDQPDRVQEAAALLGLLVAREGRRRARRQNGSAVSVGAGCSADSSLESGPHGF